MPELGEFVPELLCLGVDLVICGVLYKAYSSTTVLLRDLAAAPQLGIDEGLAGQVERHPAAVRDLQTGTVTLPYAAVRGVVAPLGKLVSSSYSVEPVQGVIQRVLFTEHKRNMSRTGFWVDSERVLHQYTNAVPFCLTNPMNQVFSLMKPHVEVVDWSDAARIDLETVFDKFESAEGGLGNHIWGWVMGDMQKGLQKTELMLTSGSAVTGVGELVLGPAGQLSLQPPRDGRAFYLVRNSLVSLAKELEGTRTLLKVFLGIFGGVGAFITGIAAWKYYKKLQSARAAGAATDRLASIRAGRAERQQQSGNGQVPESLQCVVCLTGEREVILLDCGHVCVCADCAEQLLSLPANPTCPVCRAPILSVMPAYVS